MSRFRVRADFKWKLLMLRRPPGSDDPDRISSSSVQITTTRPRRIAVFGGGMFRIEDLQVINA